MDTQQVEEQPAGSATSSEQHIKAQEFKNSGNDKFNKNNYKGAIVDYKKGLLHEPNNSDLHANLSAAYIHLEKYMEAEEHAVYAIHLRPNFYKGYMRAAKAAHGKGMTRLAVKRLVAGLTIVTEPNGVKELSRLKNQYTSYLSLQSNAEREIDIDSDRYQSDDEDDEHYSDEDDDEPDDDLPPPPNPAPPVVVKPLPILPPNKTVKSSTVSGSPKSVAKVEDPSKAKVTESSKAPGSSRVLPLTKEEPKKTVAPTKVEEAKPTSSQAKVVEKNTPFCRKESDPTEEPYAQIIKDLKENLKKNVTEKNTLFCRKEIDPTEEPYAQMIKDLRKENLKKNVTEFKEQLKVGSEAYLSGNYRKAVESYKAAKERVGTELSNFEIDDKQYQVMKYALCAALINLNSYDDIVKALQSLGEMVEVSKFSMPAFYIQQARAYCKLNRFKAAVEPLEKLQEILDNYVIFPTFTWPGTTETIQETTPVGLKDAIKELNQMSRMSHKPTAVCRFENCLKTSSHILPSELIYLSDPDFTGYVRMSCEEKCNVEFHIPCWKSYKESICGIGKINDKDLLGRRCLTTDCVNSDGDPSQVTIIAIIGPDGQVKSANKLDPKVVGIDAKKQKKRKAKLDDKEKVIKQKKTKEKRVREVKKPVVAAEEEEEPVEHSRRNVDTGQGLESRKQSLAELRDIKFGLSDNYWNPKLPCYGRELESLKATTVPVLEESTEQVDVKDAKEFIFSYFMTILKDEGPLKQTDIEDIWKYSAGDFCDITVVLPNMKSMCELLMECTRFCQLEDYICLSEQLDEAYNMVHIEMAGSVQFLMTGSTTALETSSPQTNNTQTWREVSSDSDSESEDDNSSEESDNEFYIEESDNEVNIVESDNEVYIEESDNEFYIEENNTQHQTPPTMPVIVTPKPVDDGRYSLQEMLNEMTRVKNIFMQGSDEVGTGQKAEEYDSSKDTEESASNDTFETAHGSSDNMTDDAKDTTSRVPLENSDEDKLSDDEPTSSRSTECDRKESTLPELLAADKEEVQKIIPPKDEESVTKPEEPESPAAEIESDNSDCNKATQSHVPTAERHMQTTPLETKDRLSQTKESDLFVVLNKKLQDQANQLVTLTKENGKLAKEVYDKEALNKQAKIAQEEALNRLREENRKNLEVQKSIQEQLKADSLKKEVVFKKKEEELSASLNQMKELYGKIMEENGKRNNELAKMSVVVNELKTSLDTATTNMREYDSKYNSLEETMKAKLQKSLQVHLHTIKAYWESQINQLRKRCVEKISEMQNWFTMFPPEEVEDLPSWGAVRQNTIQWVEISKTVQQIEANFQVKYTELEGKIAWGDNVDLSTLVLPTLPDEPIPLPLDQIHREITEKHFKKINELTQLVANQQLEINKTKEANQQIHQLFQMGQMPTPYGGLGIQYPFLPAMPPPRFGHSPLTTMPPPNPETVKSGNATNMLQAEVQTLLQENSKPVNLTTTVPVVPPPQSGQQLYPKTLSSLPSGVTPSPPPVIMPATSMPPPPIGVAQNLLKAITSVIDKKETVKPPDWQVTAKPEPKVSSSCSSRESTPVPTPHMAPTPEKSKKKKKSKSENRESSLVGKATPPVMAEPIELTEDNAWSVVGVPKAKQPTPSTLPQNDSKLKNKKKLLDKLQIKFHTMPLRELDDIVKLVREENNGSLSGLAFDDIESRVGRIITKRHFQKTSTMGLIKFSEAAWGTVKQQEIIPSSNNWHCEECIFCLEVMGSDRTRVECNHEFHTKCLRKWLKEKSVCPLCNKFTTMPDEFPAL